MNQKLIEKSAAKIFQILFEGEMTEAESVAALCLGTAMRLAYDSKDFGELTSKMHKLSSIFENYVKENEAAFKSSLSAKKDLPQ